MSTTIEVGVAGIGFWSPRLPGWSVAEEVLRGAPLPESRQSRPAPVLLASTERRRAPDTVAVALEVAGAACAMAGQDPRKLPSVFASTHGDLSINDYMCETLRANPRLLSPTKFHNSVHNAASGYWTIGTGCLEASTALTAWQDTFAAGLLEAVSQVATEERSVLLVAYDVAAKGPLATVTPSADMLGGALVLSPVVEPGKLAVLRCSVVAGTCHQSPPLPAAWEAALAGIPVASLAALFAALSSGQEAKLEWSVGRASTLVVEVFRESGTLEE